MSESSNSLAFTLANSIKEGIDTATADKRVSKASIHTSYALHIALEAIAHQLDVDPKQFKKDCGVGQPLAYFV